MSKSANDRWQRQILESVISELWRLYLQSGRPAYQEMEAIAEKTDGIRDLPHSTIYDVLKTKRLRLPDLQFVIAFVTVCRVYAARIGVPLDQLATVEDWRRRWYLASRACTDTAPWPVNAVDIFELEAQAAARDTSRRARTPWPSLRARAETLAAPAGLHPRQGPGSRATLLAMARHTRTMSWWHPYGDVVADWFTTYLSLEPAADLIRVYETRHVPDLLQTDEYARAMIRYEHPEAGTNEIDHRLELRMRRQQILHRPNATTLWGILDEGCFHHPAVPRKIVRRQVEHLLGVAQQPNIAVQLMTGGLEASACDAIAGGPIATLRFPQPELPDMVYLPQNDHALYPDKPDDIDHYTQVLDRLGIEATKRTAIITILNQLLTNL
ncbi:DUF5753 domain-containing protein [Actinoallomurus acaciae]|uniref:DUF5753 domain-containing protein n=1 Tax=Actinoallomurus acaciae TaxID=502577 RepID=A0ABV5Y8S3_9ACTN